MVAVFIIGQFLAQIVGAVRDQDFGALEYGGGCAATLMEQGTAESLILVW